MSRPVRVTIPHSLGRVEARRRIVDGFGRMRDQLAAGIRGGSGGWAGAAMLSMFSFSEQWNGDRLEFEGGGLGQRITGRIDVGEDSVVMEVDLPEILASLADQLAGRLKQEGTKLLEKK